jgi:hypothetical protein
MLAIRCSGLLLIVRYTRNGLVSGTTGAMKHKEGQALETVDILLDERC